MFNAIVISLATCVGVQAAWHLFTCRSHRGGHARADVMYSPYTLAERVERERSQDANQQRDTGKHHINPPRSPHAVGLSAGELPLLSGYVRERITEAN
jgi:hypothetical protein